MFSPISIYHNLCYIRTMKICGIVCEYNPFHNGHIHHINKTKEVTECDLLIAVMSGNFVQRGEPAIVSKWKRAEMAIKHGVDLVIELPFIYATQSAKYFALGSMHLLNLAGCDCFCFGSESNNLEILKECSKIELYNPDKTIAPVQSYEILYGTMNSNDILGINYLKYADKLEAYCIQRSNHYFDEELEDKISSATSIRLAVKNNQDISKATPMMIQNPVYLKDFYPLIQSLLLTLSKDYLKELFLMDEGIENLLVKNALYPNFEEFMEHSISKKYTRSKIQRTLIHLLNQTTKATVNNLELPNYIRVLAANEKGRKHLKTLECTVASRFNQIPEDYRKMELKATQVYSSMMDEEKKKQCKDEELRAPIFI